MRKKSTKYSKFFDKDEINKKGICKGCKTIYSWKSGTSRLKRHKEDCTDLRAFIAEKEKREERNKKAEKAKQRAEEDKETDDEEAQSGGEDDALNEDQDQAGDGGRGETSPTQHDDNNAAPELQLRLRKRPVTSISFMTSSPRRDESPFNGSEFLQMGGSIDDEEEEYVPPAKKTKNCRKRNENRDHSSYDIDGNEHARWRSRGPEEPGPSDFWRLDNDDFIIDDHISEYRPSSGIRPEENHRASPEQQVSPYRHLTDLDGKALLSVVFDQPMAVSSLFQRGFKNFINTLDSKYIMPTEKMLLEEALPAMNLDVKFQINNKLTLADRIAVSVHVHPSPIDKKLKLISIHAFFTEPSTFEPCKVLVHYAVTEDNGGEVSIGLKKLKDESNTEERLKKICFYTENLSLVQDSFERVANKKVLKEALKLPCLNQLLDETFRAFTTNLPGDWKNVALNQKRHFRDNLLAVKDKELQSLIESLLETEEDCWKKHRKYVTESVSDRQNRLNNEEQQTSVLMDILYKEIENNMDNFRCGDHLPASSIIPLLRSLMMKIEALMQVHRRQHQWFQCILPRIDGIYKKCFQNKTLRIATYLDSRFKNVYFTDDFKFATEHLEKDVKPTIPNPEDVPTKEEEAALPGSKLAIMDYQKKTPWVESLEKELEFYEYLRHPDNATPSEFWKMHENNLPILCNLAKNYLHLPAIATGAEELFTAGQTMLPLTPENTDLHHSLVFCFGNKKLIRNE